MIEAGPGKDVYIGHFLLAEPDKMVRNDCRVHVDVILECVQFQAAPVMEIVVDVRNFAARFCCPSYLLLEPILKRLKRTLGWPTHPPLPEASEF